MPALLHSSHFIRNNASTDAAGEKELLTISHLLLHPTNEMFCDLDQPQQTETAAAIPTRRSLSWLIISICVQPSISQASCPHIWPTVVFTLKADKFCKIPHFNSLLTILEIESYIEYVSYSPLGDLFGWGVHCIFLSGPQQAQQEWPLNRTHAYLRGVGPALVSTRLRLKWEDEDNGDRLSCPNTTLRVFTC